MEKTNRKIKKFFSRLFRRKKKTKDYQKFHESDTTHIISSSRQSVNRRGSYDCRQLEDISNIHSSQDYGKQRTNAGKPSRQARAEKVLIDDGSRIVPPETIDEEKEEELRRLFPLSYDSSKRQSNHSDTAEPPKKKKKRRKKKKKEKEQQERIDALQALPLPKEILPESEPKTTTVTVDDSIKNQQIPPSNETPPEADRVKVDSHRVVIDDVPIVADLIQLENCQSHQETTFSVNRNEVDEPVELPSPEDFLLRCSQTITSDIIIHRVDRPSSGNEPEDTFSNNENVINQEKESLILSRESINLNDGARDELPSTSGIPADEVFQESPSLASKIPQPDFEEAFNTIEELTVHDNALPMDSQPSKKKKKKKKKKKSNEKEQPKEKVKYVIDKENVRIEKQTYVEITDGASDEKPKKNKRWKKNAKKAGKETWKVVKTGWKYMKLGLVQYANGPGQAMNLSNYGKYRSGPPSDYKSRYQSYYR